jgi:uncharacterized protein YutE (UPF0331/DUF86 family)
MAFNGIISKELAHLQQRVAELRQWPVTGVEALEGNSLLRSAVERHLQVCCGIMVDVTERILAVRGLPPAETAAENFRVLEQMKVVRSAETYSRMIQFRNFVIHRYESVDSAVLCDIVKNRLDDFARFTMEISAFTESAP